MTENILRMEGITKRFYGVTAVDNVSLSAWRGEVLALVGENGAGKSTLMKILSGALQPDAGQVFFKDQQVRIDSPRRAQQLGIAIIMQEFNLLPYLTVEENILLGREPAARLGVIDETAVRKHSQELLDRLDVHLKTTELVDNLTVAQRQFVEIAKALSLGADLIIMDEPSASLTGHEIERLFQVIRGLKAQGVTVIYISHRLEEVFQIADRVVVLKDGKFVAVRDVSQVTKGELVQMMVGRNLAEAFPPRARGVGDVLLEVRGLSRQGVLHNVSLQVHAGEIVGLAGLVGAGRTELARAIFGADAIDSGEILYGGRRVRIRNPHDAVQTGIVLVPEDRKLEGLVQLLSIRKNVALPNLDSLQHWGLLKTRAESEQVANVMGRLDIRASGADQLVQSLSGGNQQKVVLAKWLVRTPGVIILDEPTRGIDVGAKAEIYRIMRQLAESGVAVLMISSELPEVLGMADRIVVMHEGSVVGEFAGATTSEEEIMHAATGGASIETSAVSRVA